MAKLNHKSTVDRTGTLSLLLSSALYFALGTAAKCSMAQDCSLCERLWWDQETWLLVPVAGLWVWELPNSSGRRTAEEMVTEDAGTGHPLWLEPTTPTSERQEGKTVLEFGEWALYL